MRPLEVLVFDDVPEVANTWVQRILGACEDAHVEPVAKQDFLSLLKLLNDRRAAGREGSGSLANDLEHVDEIDVVVADYDLLEYSDVTDTTGSRLAYLLRCFSTCGFIVVLNQFGRNVFELNLGSSTTGFADLHLGEDQLGNPGLWGAQFDGYRPWYWPVIPSARENLEKCVADVRDNFDVPILQFLNLEHSLHWLPRKAQEFLEGKQRVEEVTFADFVKSTSQGAATKDQLSTEQMTRVAAARIIRLLNLVILPEQSVLVDGPHLASRYPGLLGNRLDDIEVWNRFCDLECNGLDSASIEPVKQHGFERSHWLWRPAWHWSNIMNDESLEELHMTSTDKDVEFVFCEDISRFVPLKYAAPFRALVSAPFIKRYLFNRNADGAEEYMKHLGSKGPLDPREVEFSPQAALSLQELAE